MMFLLPSDTPVSPGDAMAAFEVKVDHDGRILLPSDLRQCLGIQPGNTVLVDITDEGMLLWTRAMAGTALQGLVSGSVPAATSLVSELRLMRRDEGGSGEHGSHGQSRSAHGRA
jgi:AbrB family looped-hinge helix DNA binding protein